MFTKFLRKVATIQRMGVFGHCYGDGGSGGSTGQCY